MICRPPTIKPSLNAGGWNIQHSRPFGKVMALAVHFKDSVIALIGHLFVASRPFAVRWLIVSVIIYSFNGMLRGWPQSHIDKERREPVAPPFANRNTATAPSWVVVISRVIASFFHTGPHAIFWSSTTSARMTMDKQCSFGQTALVFPIETSAAFSFAEFKGMSARYKGISASAVAFPCNIVAEVWSTANYGKAFKYAAGEVN